jgi:glycerophosphoryl diester phosphodiesterase
VTPSGLREISTYAAAVGVHKEVVLPRDACGRRAAPTAVVDRAHDAGLQVHVWTFRNENRFLPADLRRGTRPGDMGDARSEYDAVFSLGVDGVFTDFPDTAVAARAAHRVPGRRRLTVVGAGRS